MRGEARVRSLAIPGLLGGRADRGEGVLGEGGNGDAGVGFCGVVDAVEAEAEEAEEAGLVAGEVAEVGEVFGGDDFPAFGDEGLDVRGHFPVVDADAAGVVGLGVAVGEPVAEEPVHLFDAVLVGAFLFHDLVEEGDVEWDDGDGGAGLGDEGFVDGDPCFAAERGEGEVEGALDAFEVFLGAADGAVFVDRPCFDGADVGIGDGLGVGGEGVGGEEGIDPELPVVAAHDGGGLVDVIAGGGFDGDFVDGAGAGVEVLASERIADWFEDGFEDLAGFGVSAAWGGETVDDGIDLAEIGFEGGDDLGFDGVGEGVAVEGAGVETGFGGFFFEGGGVVPACGAAAVWLAWFFEEDPDGGGVGAEGGGDAGGEAVAGGSADDEDLFGAVRDGAAVSDDGDLFSDVSGAAVRVGGGADEPADFGGDDHGGGGELGLRGGWRRGPLRSR